MAGYTLTTASGQVYQLGSSMNTASYTPISSTGVAIGPTTSSYPYSAPIPYSEVLVSSRPATAEEAALPPVIAPIAIQLPVQPVGQAIETTYYPATKELVTRDLGTVTEIWRKTDSGWVAEDLLGNIIKTESGAYDWKKIILLGLFGAVLLKKVKL